MIEIVVGVVPVVGAAVLLARALILLNAARHADRDLQLALEANHVALGELDQVLESAIARLEKPPSGAERVARRSEVETRLSSWVQQAESTSRHSAKSGVDRTPNFVTARDAEMLVAAFVQRSSENHGKMPRDYELQFLSMARWLRPSIAGASRTLNQVSGGVEACDVMPA